MVIKFAVVLDDSLLSSSVKFLLINICIWVTPQAVSVHTRHISFSHFQTPPCLSNAPLLWVFLQRTRPAQKPQTPVCATKHISSLFRMSLEIPAWRAPSNPQVWLPEVPQTWFPGRVRQWDVPERGHICCTWNLLRSLLFILTVYSGDATAGVVERALTLESGDLD